MASEPQNPPAELLQGLIQLYSEADLQGAITRAGQLLRDFPHSSIVHNILGASYVGLGQFDVAIESYQQALKFEPNDAKTHYNLANALTEIGELPSAIASYEQALSLDPQYVPALINLGNALIDEGKLRSAIASYRRVLEIDPNYAEVYCNLGNAQKDQGELDQAIQSYRKAIKLYPDYAEAYNNLGSALNAKGERELAVANYRQAITIAPDFVDAYWNLVGTCDSSEDARAWLLKILDREEDYVLAKVQLAAVDYLEARPEMLEELQNWWLKEHPAVRSLEWLAARSELPALYYNRWVFFDAVVHLAKKDRPFYEFGVFRGESFRYLIRSFATGFGFDTFEGIPEDWREEKAGAYSSDGAIPDIADGEFVAGKFEDTLPDFFAQPRALAAIINFDADLYSSTLCALRNSKPVIDSETILIFDEFFVHEEWEQDEFRALNEFCVENDYSFEVLAVSFFTKQVALRLVES